MDINYVGGKCKLFVCNSKESKINVTSSYA